MNGKTLVLGNVAEIGEGKGPRLSLPNTEWFLKKGIFFHKKYYNYKRMGHAMACSGFPVEVTGKVRPGGRISQVREESVPG